MTDTEPEEPSIIDRIEGLGVVVTFYSTPPKEGGW